MQSVRKRTDPGFWSRLETWYQEQSRAISEICIVSLQDHANGSEHLHAVVVPEFLWLKDRKHPNSRELIRFEFQNLSKLLAPDERPDTFSLRSQPLPRGRDGKLDRDLLVRELSQSVPITSAPERGCIGSVAPRIWELLRMYKPVPAECEEMNIELDLGFDSLDRVLLLSAVEESFLLHIPDDEAVQLFTVSDLIGAVTRRVRSPAAVEVSSWSKILGRPLATCESSLADSILGNRPVITFLAWTVIVLLRPFGRFCFRFEITGREHLLPHGPFLLAANHCSHLDPLFLLWSLPFSIVQRLSLMVHTEYFGAGWKSAVAKRLKLILVDPDQYARSGMRLSVEALRRGLVEVVFPEGERSPNGALQRFHRGIAILARELSVPIVPAAILGTYEVLPRLADRLRCSPVQVRFGPAIRARAQEPVDNLLARLWKSVYDLRGSDARARQPIPDLLSIQPQRFV